MSQNYGYCQNIRIVLLNTETKCSEIVFKNSSEITLPLKYIRILVYLNRQRYLHKQNKSKKFITTSTKYLVSVKLNSFCKYVVL